MTDGNSENFKFQGCRRTKSVQDATEGRCNIFREVMAVGEEARWHYTPWIFLEEAIIF